MRVRGPLATLLAVLVAGLAVLAANMLMTDPPAPERTATLGLSSESAADDGYGAGQESGGAYGGAGDSPAAAPAPSAPGTGSPDAGGATWSAPSAGATEAPATATYDGRTAGNEVTVNMKIENGAVTAYVCDNKGIESWIRGTVQGSDLALTGKDGAVLDGRIQNGSAYGTVQVAGKSWPFSAAAPKAAPSADTGKGWS